MKKCAHIGRTRPKNVRPAAEMCAPGAECTVNFEHCYCINVEHYLCTRHGASNPLDAGKKRKKVDNTDNLIKYDMSNRSDDLRIRATFWIDATA